MRSLLFLIVLILSFDCLKAQVPVHEEPRHKPVFENSKLRLLNVLLPPGDTTQYHLHNTPSLFLFFTSTTTGSQLQGGAPATGRSVGGTILFENLAPPHVRIHRVWNEDTGTFHVMDIELLSNDSGFTGKPFNLSQLQPAVDTPWVRAYKLVLEKNTRFQVPDHNDSLLFVAFDAATVQVRKKGSTQTKAMQQGAFFWVDGKQKVVLKNLGNTTAHFALIELP